MPDYPNNPLSDEERDKIVTRCAEKVVKAGMATPAILFVESHKPLSFLAGQAVIVATPLFGALFGPDNMMKLSQILSDRSNAERFIQKIEELASLREQEKEK